MRVANKEKPDFALHPEQPWLASCCGGPEEPSNGRSSVVCDH